MKEHKVLRFESLVSDFGEMMRERGFSPELQRVSPTDDRHLNPRCRHLTTNESVQLLSTQAIAVINDVYREDFQKFGYELM